MDLDLNARGADGATPQNPGPDSEDLRDVASSPDIQTVWCHSCGMQLHCRFSNRQHLMWQCTLSCRNASVMVQQQRAVHRSPC